MLKLTNLTKQYGGNTSVDNINVEIGQGEIIGLLGPNGAGKSTTMKMITGIIAPTSGDVEFLGVKISEMDTETRKQMGYLPEIPPLYIDFTVAEHLNFVCELNKIPKEEIENEISRVVAHLKLEEMRNRLIKNLSKGYKQRVGIASAIIGNPKFLILDEPTVGLDPQQIIDIRNLILHLSKSMTVLISSHILSEISEICTRVIVIRKGKLVADGTKEELERKFNEKRMFEVLLQNKENKALETIKQIQAVEKITVEPIKAEGLLKCKIETKDNVDIRETLFKTFAKTENAILEMKENQLTLEDIFIELTK